MKFNTHYERKREKREDGLIRRGKEKGERDRNYVEPGQISLGERILAMQVAGKKLQLARAQMFDLQSENDVIDGLQDKLAIYNDRLELMREQRILSNKLANKAKEQVEVYREEQKALKEAEMAAQDKLEVTPEPTKVPED